MLRQMMKAFVTCGMASGCILAPAASPAISSFTPALGGAGTSVILDGSNFTGASAVKFNGVGASSFVINSPTRITAVVPASASTGKISVTTSGGTATSSSTFTFVPAPKLTSFSPSSGGVGTTVTMTGTNFIGTTSVKFNGTAASSFTVLNATSATAVVPSGATTGKIALATPGGSATSSTSFTVGQSPAITTQPTSRTTNLGSSATFTVMATGTAPLAYQWARNGADIPGATASSYTTPPAVMSDNGTAFTVRVSNAYGAVTSNAAIQTIPVKVTVAPISVTMDQGSQRTFTATVTGTIQTAVTWTCTAGFIGQDGVFTAPNAAGSVTVTATSADGSGARGSATVTVRAVGISSISTYPGDHLVALGDQLQCWVTVSGTVDTRTTWTVLSGGGHFDYSGNYNPLFCAPSTVGTATIQATSVADPSKSITTTLTLADNGGRPVFTSVGLTPSPIALGQPCALAWSVNQASSVTIKDMVGHEYEVSGQSSMPLNIGDYIDTMDMVTVRLEASNAGGSTTYIYRSQASFPWIQSLSIDPPVVKPGETVTVAAVFQGGNGRIEPNQGSVSSGVPTIVNALGSPDQRLVVENAFGGKDELELGVAVRSPKGTIQRTGSLPTRTYSNLWTYSDNELCRVVPLRDGRVAAFGIIDETSLAMSLAVYDPLPGSFTTLAPLERRDYTVPLCLADGSLLFAGSQSSERIDPNSGVVTHPQFGYEMQQFSATLLADGNVLFAGGEYIYRDQSDFLWPGFPLNCAKVWNPSIDQMVFLPEMRGPRSRHSAIRLFDNRVLIVGGLGLGGEYQLDAEIYDPNTQAFAPSGSLQRPATHPRLNLLPDGRVLVFGTDTELFDPGTGQFTIVSPNPPWANALLSALPLPDGHVLSGEAGSRGTIFDPATSRYFQVDSPSGPSTGIVWAAPLADGRVLWAGVNEETSQGVSSLLFDSQPEVAITPFWKSVHAAEFIDFTATIQGGGSVTWSVNPADATISGSGRFRATRAGTYVVSALTADGRKGFAWIEVLPMIQALRVVPSSTILAAGGTLAFTAFDQNSAVQATWETTAGSIDANGVFTAPATSCTATITGFRADDPTRGGSTTVQVLALPIIQAFTANPPATAPGQGITLSWAVDGASSLTLDPGQVDVTGTTSLLVTPGTATTYTLTARNALGSVAQSVTVLASVVLSIAVNPGPRTMIAGTSNGFARNITVLNGYDPTVTWTASAGTLVVSGQYNEQVIYTAPLVPGTYTITETSVADPTRSASVTVTVVPLVVTVDPDYIVLEPATRIHFGFSVNAGGLVWSATGGSFDQEGWYTAPNLPGTYTATAASSLDPAVSASLTVVVKAIKIYLTPTKVTLAKNAIYRFMAATSAGNVVWSAPVGGTVTWNGTFTAPSVKGTYSVLATSSLDPTAHAMATVVVDDSGLSGGGAPSGDAGPPSPATVGVEVTPAIVAELATGSYQSFSATVYGSQDPDVIWEVNQNIVDPVSGLVFGKIDESGVFTAGYPGYYVIKATSKTNSNKFGTAVILVKHSMERVYTAPANALYAYHSVTALKDGRVLIAGGSPDGINVAGDCFIYDPASGTTLRTGSLNVPRSGHQAVLLTDGRVLAVQGYGNRDQLGDPQLHGMGDLPHSECYDPATEQWTSLPLMKGTTVQGSEIWNLNKAGSSLALANGQALILGGSTFYGDFDPNASIFTGGSFLSISWQNLWWGLWFPLVRLQDGRAFYCGGYTDMPRPNGNSDPDWPIMNAAMLYEPGSNTATYVGTMTSKRLDHTATVLADGRVLIVGGVSHNERAYGDISRQDQYIPTSSCEIFDPANGTFTATGNMAFPRAGHAAILLPTGQVLVAGGYFQVDVDDRHWYLGLIERYDPASGTWSVMDTLDYGLSEPKLALMNDGSVFIAGQVQAPMEAPAVIAQARAAGPNGMMAADLASTTLMIGSTLFGTMPAPAWSMTDLSLNQGVEVAGSSVGGTFTVTGTQTWKNVPLVIDRPALVKFNLTSSNQWSTAIPVKIEIPADSTFTPITVTAKPANTGLLGGYKPSAKLLLDAFVIPKANVKGNLALKLTIQPPGGITPEVLNLTIPFQAAPPMTIKLVRVKYIYVDNGTRKVEWVGRTDASEFTAAATAAETCIKSYFPVATSPTIVVPQNDPFFVCSEDYKDESGNLITAKGSGVYSDGSLPPFNLSQSSSAWGDVHDFAQEWVPMTSTLGINGAQPANTFVALVVPRIAGHTYLVNGGNARGVGTHSDHFVLYLYNEGEVIAHEVGHAHGRDHIKWPLTGNVPASPWDANYPYSNGVIGVNGWDPLSGTSKDKGAFVDIMTYGTPRWISDYTFYWLWKYDFDMWPGKPQ